jgi:uroporphyrinogen decarboxylase
MNPKELLFKILKHEETERAAWVPFAGVHAGKLVGYNAEEVLKDGDKLFEALIAVNNLYKPDGQPIVFDLQLEAECLGCDLIWSKSGPRQSLAIHLLSRQLFHVCVLFLLRKMVVFPWF